MGGIYWLASYPNSGNTWFRAFLRNLQDDGAEPADVIRNRLAVASSLASHRGTRVDEAIELMANDGFRLPALLPTTRR